MNQTPLPTLQPATAADQLAETLRLTATMAEEHDSLALLRQGLELCTRIFSSERGFLISQDLAGSLSVIERVGNLPASDSYSTTAIRLVAQKREPLLITDTIQDSALSAQESISRNDIRSILCAILDTIAEPAGERCVYLYLDSRTDRHPLTLGDLERFRLLCRTMSALTRKAALVAQQEATIEELRSRIDDKRLQDLVFGSDSFRRCLTLVKQAAPTDVPVLLLGETGTGKERLARLVHDLSPRATHPFLAVNCGAFPPNLIESQLFGHEKGAFTGAVSTRKGVFEEASGGTLFLDEVGELPPSAQAQFLRALQEGEIVRVGAAKPIRVDVRVVAATNVDLEKSVAEGKFRKDLFFRLNVLPVNVPPVRERGEDALLLARFFLERYCTSLGGKRLTFSRDAEKALLAFAWPGNVREIQNRVQRAVITASGPTIGRAELGLEVSGPSTTNLRDAREALDRELIAVAMSRSPGNLTNAAKILGIDRKSLRIMLEKYGMATEGLEA